MNKYSINAFLIFLLKFSILMNIKKENSNNQWIESKYNIILKFKIIGSSQRKFEYLGQMIDFKIINFI